MQETQPKSATIDGAEITILPDGMEVDDILGWVVHYTIGRHFAIDREWLEDKADEFGIPRSELPAATTRKRAFKRAGKERVPQLMNDQTADAVTFEGDAHNSNMINLDVSDRRDRDMEGETLARFVWNPEEGSARAKLVAEGELENAEWYEQAVSLFWDQFELMQHSNLSRDVSRSIRRWIKGDTASVKMRDGGAVYFVPRGAGDVLSGFKKLAAAIDEEWKAEDHQCGVDAIEVFDSEDKQDMVERKARNQMSSLIDKTIDKALDELDEDTAATKAVNKASDKLVRADNIAVEHNALLDVEMSLKSELNEWKESATEEKRQKIIEAALDEVDT